MNIRSITLWALGLGGAAVVITLFLTSGSLDHDPSKPSMPPGKANEVSGSPALAGSGNGQKDGLLGGGDRGERREPATTLSTLEALWDAAPAGVAEEWAVTGMGRGRRVDREVLSLIEAMVHGLQMDTAPYDGALAFGRSDLPWLGEMLKLFEIERDAAEAAHTGVSDKVQAVEELQVYYRQVLADVAEKRVLASKSLAARYKDGTLLRDMEDKRWLAAALSVVESGSLWAYTDWMPKRYRQLLSARDLSYVLEVSREIDRINRDGPYPGASTAEKSTALANEVGRFRDYLASRERD